MDDKQEFTKKELEKCKIELYDTKDTDREKLYIKLRAMQKNLQFLGDELRIKRLRRESDQ